VLLLLQAGASGPAKPAAQGGARGHGGRMTGKTRAGGWAARLLCFDMLGRWLPPHAAGPPPPSHHPAHGQACGTRHAARGTCPHPPAPRLSVPVQRPHHQRRHHVHVHAGHCTAWSRAGAPAMHERHRRHQWWHSMLERWRTSGWQRRARPGGRRQPHRPHPTATCTAGGAPRSRSW
jgi:hypothetical protein